VLRDVNLVNAPLHETIGNDSLKAIGGSMPFLGTNRWALAIVSALVAVIILSAWLIGRLSEQSLLGDLQQRLGSSLDVHASGLVGDLSDYPAALSMLASDPRILLAVVGGDQEMVGSAQARLRRYADLTGVDNVMIVGADGHLIADHNDDPDNAERFVAWFIEQPAFKTALASGLGRAFGVTGEGGARRYVFARRIANPGKEPALLIVAVSLDHTELLWRLAEQDILVVDQQGTVLLSSDQGRHFERLGPISEARTAGEGVAHQPCREGAIANQREHICLAKSIARLGWDIYLIGEIAPVRDQVRLLQWVTALGLISLALLIGVIAQRRLALQRTLRIKEDANRLLQQRVDRRTGELRAANEQLQVEIDERIAKERALRDAQTELVQTSKLAALGQLSAGIAHQLNQPLAALRAYADNARTFLARGQTAPADENLSLIGDLTERIAKITKDLKVIARRQPTRTEPVALPPLVRSVIDQIEQADAAHSVEIVYDEEAATPLAEPIGLQQVLANLIQNGIDAMEMAESLEKKTLWITTSIDADRVRLEVADRGIGLAPEHIDRVFDPFFTTKEVGKGLGLGLSLSASMIQDMGGQLLASNRDGGGACFTIELERASEERSAA
jgi:two-component system C4-dicarboxylate transport sensor histidine kinase DctB